MEPYILLIVLPALLITFLVLAQRAAKKRRLALMAWAANHGLSFSPARDKTVDNRFAFFPLFRTGKDRYGMNVITGELRGHEVWLFDYHYATESRGSKGETVTHHHELTAVLLNPRLKLKPLAIRTETFMDRAAGFLGIRDIEFELAEFNREFHVRSTDRRWAFDILHQEAMEYLLKAPRYQLEMADGWLLVQRDRVLDVEALDEALGVGTDFLGLIPNSVVRELMETDRSV